MIYALLLMAYIVFTLYHISNEITFLPSLEDFFTVTLGTEVACVHSMMILFLLLILFPLLFGLLLIVAYGGRGLNFKRSPSKRYSILCTTLLYSILIHITTDVFFFMEFLTSSKIVYFLFRMYALANARGHMMVLVYKSFIIHLLNSLSFMAIFFMIETYMAITSNSTATPFNIFVRKNKIAMSLFGTIAAAYILAIKFFSYRYHLTANKETVVHIEPLWASFIGSIMINGLLIGFYHILSLNS